MQTRKPRQTPGEYLKMMLAEFAAIVGLSESREKEVLERANAVPKIEQVLVRATCTCDAGEKFTMQFPTDHMYLHGDAGGKAAYFQNEFLRFMHELQTHGLATGRASFTLERVKD